MLSPRQAHPVPDCPGPQGPPAPFASRRVRALERIALLLRWTAATGAVVFVVWLLGDVLLLVFAAALLALGLRGLANFLSRVVGIKSDPLLVAIVVMRWDGDDADAACAAVPHLGM